MNHYKRFQKLHHIEPKLVFTSHISPFEIAFYSLNNNTIYIDNKFLNSKYLPNIIEHEMEHARSNKFIDWQSERGMTWRMFRALLGHKRLWIFAGLMPIVWVKDNGKYVWGIEFFRLTMLGIFILYLLLITGGISWLISLLG